MLCPEVWNFTPTTSSFSNKFCESEEEIFRNISKQLFNHHASIILPNTLKLPVDLINAFTEDSQYYKVSCVPAFEFLDEDFINLFILKGQLTAISINSKLEKKDALECTPDGYFILSLSKKSFLEVGIDDCNIKHHRNSEDDSVVILDLKSDFNQSKKKLRLLKKKIKSSSTLLFDVVLIWQPNVTEICPSSIALYFSQKGYTVQTCELKYESKHIYNVNVPKFDDMPSAGDLFEWLGAFTLQCDMENDDHISSMKILMEQETFGQVLLLNFIGLFTGKRIETIVSIIRNSMVNSSSSWIGLIVHGFKDSMIATEKKSFFQVTGNHYYSLIFKMNGDVLLSTFHDNIVEFAR